MRSRAPEVSDDAGPPGRRASSSSCATATTCSSRPASPRPSTGRGPSTTSAPPSSTWRPPPRTLGALVKYREDADRVQARARPDAARPMSAPQAGPTPRRRRDPARRSPGRCARPGVPVTQDRAHGFLAAAALRRRSTTSAATYWAGRATLCAGPDDLARYDQVFEAWFDARDGLPAPGRRETAPSRRRSPLPEPTTAARARPRTTTDVAARRGQRRRGAAAPRRRRARRRPRRHRLAAMFAHAAPAPAACAVRARHRRWHRGERRRLAARCATQPAPDGRAGARSRWRRRGTRPRRVVLLVDVSRLDERVRRRAAAAGPPADRGRGAPAARSRRSPSAPG